MTFLDVGQGDAVLLETPRARVLVDQGPPEGDAAAQLVDMGIGSLSALVLTHPQRDHVGGAADVLRRLDVGQVLDPDLAATGPEREEALRVARADDVPVRVVRAGATLPGGWARPARALARRRGDSERGPEPQRGRPARLLRHDRRLSPRRCRVGRHRASPLPEVEILKVAHHGSEDPGLAEELRELRPRVAVISCGRDNDYGHPRAETVAALESSPGLALYRTDEDGGSSSSRTALAADRGHRALGWRPWPRLPTSRSI